MFSETIHPATQRVLEQIGPTTVKHGFYMAGDTALALQLGHRESIDLDWFKEAAFSPDMLERDLREIGTLMLSQKDAETLDGYLNDVKVSFFRYPYKNSFEALSYKTVQIADKRDISAMKLSAISSRGSKKDFIDLFELLQTYTLQELLGFFEKKYIAIQHNKIHLLKSLTYFNDAETDPMPVMVKKIDWQQVKNTIQQKVTAYFQEAINDEP